MKLCRIAVALMLMVSSVAAQQPSARPPAVNDFGRMFPELPPYQPADDLLVALALAMQDPNLDSGDNPARVPSGFTYLGQFLDHDLTLDRTRLEDANEIDQLVNSRTAKLDLDSMYGGGPTGSPELYDSSGRFRFSQPFGFDDFQRSPEGVAVVPEGRNDENLVIAQIHLAIQKFHNAFIDNGLSFEAARQSTTRHWQWAVVHEFLPEICGQAAVDEVLSYNGAGKPKVTTRWYRPGNRHQAMMPLEFAAAAYRFGHSMVRLAYIMPTGSVTKTQVFNAAQNDLHGSRPIPPSLKIDFNNFFSIPGLETPPGRNISRRVDALISRSLYFLPIGSVVPPDPPAVTSLPERNLLRGKRIGLPSYQDVARAVGVTPLTNAELGLVDPGWGDGSPLWFGILKESEITENGVRLGPTGARIVAEVILGIIEADKDSYFHTPQPWAPMTPTFRIVDLLGASSIE